MVPLSVPAGTPRGECDLAFISGCVRFLRVSVDGNHIVLGRLQVRRTGIGSASRWFAVALTAATVAACAQAPVVANKPSSFDTGRHASIATKKRAPAAEDKADKQNAEAAGESYGLASFYGHQSRTASGEKFNPHELTAAHRTLPFGTRVRVTDVSTGRSVTVRVNDRGPFVPGRVVDISSSAAETLGISGRGVAKVKLDVVD
jgi:rare lipoprotein A